MRSHINRREERVPMRTLGPEGRWVVKAFFLRVWKLLPSRHVSKILMGSPIKKAQRGQYLLAAGLGYYKWYQSQTMGDVPARRLSPEESGHKAVCQQGR